MKKTTTTMEIKFRRRADAVVDLQELPLLRPLQLQLKIAYQSTIPYNFVDLAAYLGLSGDSLFFSWGKMW